MPSDRRNDKMKLSKQIFKTLVRFPTRKKPKLTIIGCGPSGMSLAIALIYGGLFEITLIDIETRGLASKQMLGLQHVASFCAGVKIHSGYDLKASCRSDICVLTTECTDVQDTRTNTGNLGISDANLKFYQIVVPELVKYSPDTILIVTSFPYDPMTHLAWSLSKLPKHRVIGIGSCIDTASFLMKLAERLDIHTNSISAWVIGLQLGKIEFPVWSDICIGGSKLIDKIQFLGTATDPYKWHRIRNDITFEHEPEFENKIYPYWTAAAAVSFICNSIVQNTHTVLPVSTCGKGLYGITNDTHLSLPCILGINGIYAIVKQQLIETDEFKLRRGTAYVKRLLKKIN